MATGNIKIFYSYCSKDSDSREALDKHLCLLKENGIISTWDYKKIQPGDTWAKEIDKYLIQADIVLFLLSADFLNSDACKQELQVAKDKSKRIIPIILADCSWEDFIFSNGEKLGDLQAVPINKGDLCPISKWKDKDEAWKTVYEKLKNICEAENSSHNKGIAASEKQFPSIPEGYAKPKVLEIEQKHRKPLWVTAILGRWNENSPGDRDIIEKVTQEVLHSDFDIWLHNIREVKSYNDEILLLRNGHWQVENKESILMEHASFFYDDHLELIKSVALEILSERDPQFDLNSNERLMAVVRGKIPKYSSELRKGVSETLVFLAMHSSKLENCTQDRPEDIVSSVIKEIFKNADWKLWASLNDVLPILAEAAPAEFLKSVEKALDQSPCPFDEFLQRKDGIIINVPYLEGLYWALESLAWSKEYLSRSILALAGIAKHDSGGTWTNHPINSITTILLPWLPQTVADAKNRIGSLRAVQNRYPDIVQDVLLTLLPNQHQQSFGSHKPKFRKFIPDDWEGKVSDEEYWQQVKEYANIAVEMAKGNIKYISKLVENLDNILEPAYSTLLKYLKSEEIKNLSDEQKQLIWENMISFVRKHRRFSYCEWALPSDKIDLLENIAEELAPSHPDIFYRHLFSNKDFEYIEKKVDVETHGEMMRSKRIEALGKIYSTGGTDAILSFSNKVDAPYEVGRSFAEIANEESDNKFLPSELDSKTSSEEQFIREYVCRRYLKNGTDWLERLGISGWTNEQKSNLLSYSPFEEEIWKKADELLGKNVVNYWSKVRVHPFSSKSDLLPAVNNLLKYNRPYFALECIYAHYYSTQQILKEQAIKALLDGLSSSKDIEYLNSTDGYQIIKIIQALQTDPDVKEDDLVKIEWGYLPLLKNYERHSEAKPKFLEKRLSQKPDFFIEIIQLITQTEEINEEEQKLAYNAWNLLHRFWQHPPGTQDDGSFSDDELKNWYREVKDKTKELDYYKFAMERLGRVLFYADEDIDGLWIKESVANILNEKENGDMRQGFISEVYNSRGIHQVDPLGRPEKELAALWHKRAEEVDNKGYAYFAASLKDIAQSYEREAERIIAGY